MARLPFKRNIKGLGLTYSNVNQQLKNHPAFTRRVVISEEDEASVLPTREQICQALLNLPGNNPQHVVVAQELHQDGNIHFHCYLQWLEPHSNVDANYFNLWGMHPNVQQIKQQEDWLNYIQKEDVTPFVWVPITYLTSDDEGYTSEEIE